MKKLILTLSIYLPLMLSAQTEICYTDSDVTIYHNNEVYHMQNNNVKQFGPNEYRISSRGMLLIETPQLITFYDMTGMVFSVEDAEVCFE